MYAEDTFFHLSTWGRTGLVCLSVFLAAITVWGYWQISNRFGFPVKVFAALVFIWLFIWLSPQAYYLYYMLVFDSLPLQIVIAKPPSPAELFSILFFAADTSLSDHGKAALFWLMAGFAIWQKIRK